jgi:hypothetical protein
MQVEIINELIRHFDERNISGNAAVVPPIRLQRRDAVGQADVVDRNHYKIRAIFEYAGHLRIERSKSTREREPETEQFVTRAQWQHHGKVHPFVKIGMNRKFIC